MSTGERWQRFFGRIRVRLLAVNVVVVKFSTDE